MPSSFVTVAAKVEMFVSEMSGDGKTDWVGLVVEGRVDEDGEGEGGCVFVVVDAVASSSASSL